jgi:hypothetical protein
MSDSSRVPRWADERRAAQRFPCDAYTSCRVTDLLDLSTPEAYPWDLSGGGICVLLEYRYPPGTRLGVELSDDGHHNELVVWLRVEHSDICCPGPREMWLTGCSFVNEVATEDLRAFLTH